MRRSPRTLTRREFLGRTSSFGAIAVLGSRAEDHRAEVTVGCLRSAEYREQDGSILLFADEPSAERRATLHVDDVVALVRAVWLLTSGSFMFTLEPDPGGKRMIPYFRPTPIEPILGSEPFGATRVALTAVYVDLLLKGASLGLPYARACGFFPSELDLVAGELARKAASGDAVPQVRRFVHRFFFVLSGVTDRSRDWLRVSYPDPTVRVEFVPESPSTVAGQIVSELRFRDVVQTNFDQLLEADGRAGEECRRLRNLFIVAKVASWLRDLRVPIDTTRLASFALGRWRYPHISLHSLSRTVTHPTRGSHVVQLAGGVAFDVSNPTRTDADRAASGHHGDVDFPLANVVGTTPRLASHRQALKERSPPHFAVDHVRVDGRRMVQLDLGRLLGLQKGALT